jgi:hypothetical protein
VAFAQLVSTQSNELKGGFSKNSTKRKRSDPPPAGAGGFVMLEDAVKTEGLEDRLSVKEISETVCNRLT